MQNSGVHRMKLMLTAYLKEVQCTPQKATTGLNCRFVQPLLKWKSQKKNKLGRCLLEPKLLKANQNKGMQQTEQKATNASPSLKLRLHCKRTPLPLPWCEIVFTMKNINYC